MTAPSGIWAMQFALFDDQERLDRAMMQRQAQATARSGAHGIATLGLGTEVGRLSDRERHDIVEWTVEAAAGERPVVVTAPYPSVAEQIAFVRFAERSGAALAILQPPPVRGLAEDEYIRYFGRIADAVDLPLGIQNAPDLIGIGLSPAGLATLVAAHPNIVLIKEERSAIAVRDAIAMLPPHIAVFNGRGGLELVENLDFGCAGMIPGAETADVQSRIFDLHAAGRIEDAAREYRAILPLLVFLFQSLDTFLLYGKTLVAARLDLPPPLVRAPSAPGSPHALALLRSLAADLPPLV